MSFMIVEFIQFFFFNMILNRVTRILKLFSTSNLSFHQFSIQQSRIPLEKTIHEPQLSRTHLSFTNKIRGNDLELVIASLGLSSHPDNEKLPEVLSFKDIFNMFEEEEPRLDEVKEAFDVFDGNKDGFIDAWELHRVMGVLGLKEGTSMEDCRKMIGAFDGNADGRIDLEEFVKLMEESFC